MRALILSILSFVLALAQAPQVAVTTRASQSVVLTSAQADQNLLDLQHSLNAAQTGWGYNQLGSMGLFFAYYGGTAWNGTAYTTVLGNVVLLTASATNYVQRTDAGLVTANTTGFTAGQQPLYRVVTGASAITAVYDSRTSFQTSGGAVASVFGRTGAVVAGTGDYVVAQVTGAAPLISPTFTGTVTAPIFSGAVAVGNGINVGSGGPGVAGSISTNLTQGLALQSKTGSSYDFSLINPANSVYIMTVPTGTTNVVFNGTVSASTFSGPGTGLTGTASGLSVGSATTASSATTAGTATAANGINSSSTTVATSGSAAPSAGQYLVASSSTAAAWQTLPPGVANPIIANQGANLLTTLTAGNTFYTVFPNANTLGANSTLSFPANYFTVGRMLEIELVYLWSGVISGDLLVPALQVAGVDYTFFSVTAPSTTNFYTSVKLVLTCTATGTSGNLASSSACFMTPVGSSTLTAANVTNPGNFGFNTTISNSLAIRAQNSPTANSNVTIVSCVVTAPN